MRRERFRSLRGRDHPRILPAVPALVEQLRKQHAEIEALTTRIEAALRDRDPAALAHEVGEFQRTLMAHLELEDRRLYPALVERVEAHGASLNRSVVATYRSNMAQIGETLRHFFDSYSDPIDLAGFARNWPMVQRLLSHRIESEELTLYPLYLELVPGPDDPA